MQPTFNLKRLDILAYEKYFFNAKNQFCISVTTNLHFAQFFKSFYLVSHQMSTRPFRAHPSSDLKIPDIWANENYIFDTKNPFCISMPTNLQCALYFGQ